MSPTISVDPIRMRRTSSLSNIGSVVHIGSRPSRLFSQATIVSGSSMQRL